MSGTYPLTKAEANGIIAATERGVRRMIAVEDLMDLPIHMGGFDDTLDGVLGKRVFSADPPLETQMEHAYHWLNDHYDILCATFTAVRELVDDTRDGREMLAVHGIQEYFRYGEESGGARGGQF